MKGTIKERIIQVMEDGQPRRVKEIAELTGRKIQSVRAMLSMLASGGLLQHVGVGTYRKGADDKEPINENKLVVVTVNFLMEATEKWIADAIQEAQKEVEFLVEEMMNEDSLKNSTPSIDNTWIKDAQVIWAGKATEETVDFSPRLKK